MEKSLDRSRQVSVEGKWSKAREIYIHQIRRSHACWPHHVVVVNLKHAATCSPLLPLPTTSVDEDTIYGKIANSRTTSEGVKNEHNTIPNKDKVSGPTQAPNQNSQNRKRKFRVLENFSCFNFSDKFYKPREDISCSKPIKNATCFNCLKFGHFSNKCQKPKHMATDSSTK
uniref:CCHC-type domain-containing protein n=1 Tax=Oryza punctata TaxID=4537 RepID=A0A0E0MM60_ORYPU